MNHGLKLHPDGTLEITMPRGKKVKRVLVCEARTQNGSLYYEEERWNRLMMYLADIQLTYAPADGLGDEKLYGFITEIIRELERWDEQGD